jgi:hypothetical protein
MESHTQRSVSSNQNNHLAEYVIHVISEIAGGYTHGHTLATNEQKDKILAQGRWIPVDQLLAYLTQHEVQELEKLPFWTGGNQHLISSKVLCLVISSIYRFEWETKFRVNLENQVFSLKSVYEEKGRDLWKCLCQDCIQARKDINLITGFRLIPGSDV